MAHFNFVISQNAKWGHSGFNIDCHRMTVPENILLQKSTGYRNSSSLSGHTAMGTHMPGNAARAQKKDSGGIKVQKKI